MTKKTTLYVGLNDKDTKYQIIDSLEAQKVIINFLLSYGIDGATVFNATGLYRHDNGTVVIENTLRVELFEVDNDALIEAVKAIKTALNQESIVIQREVIDSEFI